jgi:hypothetical protein
MLLPFFEVKKEENSSRILVQHGNLRCNIRPAHFVHPPEFKYAAQRAPIFAVTPLFHPPSGGYASLRLGWARKSRGDDSPRRSLG